MGGKVIAGAGALLDLGAAVGPGLAHLAGHQRGELIATGAEDGGGGAHEAGALVEAGAAPGSLRLGGACGFERRVLGGVAGTRLAGLLDGGVGGGEDGPGGGVDHRIASGVSIGHSPAKALSPALCHRRPGGT